MKTPLKFFCALLVALTFSEMLGICRAASLLVDHTCTDIYQIPTNWIEKAKQQLRIAYGHRSHGAQLTDGMAALIGFMSNKGYPPCLFAWTHDGNTCADALSLPENPFVNPLDLGYPDFISWEKATRAYLATNANVNIVLWSWSSELGNPTNTDAVDTYLSLMAGLRRDYTNVTFVYMTGCLDGYGTNGYGYMRNSQIRSHCFTNGLVLYDFADIESYDPGGLTNYMVLNATDNCDYDPAGSLDRTNNWATAWQTNHILGVDWFDCFAAHSQPLNGNRKACSAWWLWARLAGWPGPSHNVQIELSNTGLPMLTYVRPASAPAASYVLQYSQNLLDWSKVPPEMILNQNETVTNGGMAVSTQLTDGFSTNGMFFRLSIGAN